MGFLGIGGCSGKAAPGEIQEWIPSYPRGGVISGSTVRRSGREGGLTLNAVLGRGSGLGATGGSGTGTVAQPSEQSRWQMGAQASSGEVAHSSTPAALK